MPGSAAGEGHPVLLPAGTGMPSFYGKAGRQLFKSPVFSGGVPVGESVQGSGKGALEYGRPAGARLQQSERRPCGNRHDDPVLERGAAGEPFSPAFFPLPRRAFYGFFLNGAARLAHACSGDAGVFRQLKCIVQQDGGLANLVLGDQGGVVLRINLDKNFPAARPSRAVSGQNQEQQKKGKNPTEMAGISRNSLCLLPAGAHRNRLSGPTSTAKMISSSPSVVDGAEK